jgi:hypothetical protein
LCDVCKTEMQNGEGGTLCLESRQSVKEHIEYAGWMQKNGKLACENCMEAI